MARSKRNRDSQAQFRRKKRLLTRKAKRRKIDIVSRRGQPQISFEVEQLKRQDIAPLPVSSSWISELGYLRKSSTATMNTIQGYGYIIRMPFSVFEEWFNAHSKGTFFNMRVKDKFKTKRIR